jgi:hypothetical protein
LDVTIREEAGDIGKEVRGGGREWKEAQGERERNRENANAITS